MTASSSATNTTEAKRILGIAQDDSFEDDDVFMSENKAKPNPNHVTTSDSDTGEPRPRRKPRKKRKPVTQDTAKEVNDDQPTDSAKQRLTYYGKSNDGSVSHFQIESFIHKSKSNFNVEDVKQALTNAKLIGENDKSIGIATQSPMKTSSSQNNCLKMEVSSRENSEGKRKDWIRCFGS